MKKSLKTAIAVGMLFLLSFGSIQAEEQGNSKEVAGVTTYQIVSDPGGGEGH